MAIAKVKRKLLRKSSQTKVPKEVCVPKVTQPEVYVNEESWKEVVSRSKRRRESADDNHDKPPEARWSDINDNDDPDLTTHEQMDTTTFTGPDFDTQYVDEVSVVPGFYRETTVVGPDTLVFDNDTEMMERPPKEQKDAQIAKLLLIAEQSKKEADKTRYGK